MNSLLRQTLNQLLFLSSQGLALFWTTVVDLIVYCVGRAFASLLYEGTGDSGVSAVRLTATQHFS